MSNLNISSEELNVPGGVGFIAVNDLVETAAEELESGTILTMEGFGLNDAMSAVEIMDARMDSGMTEPPPPFNPNMPLLPSELCWIIDRSFACEMAWHSGLALSQTIYTLRYVHHLAGITFNNFKTDTATWLAMPNIRSPNSKQPQELVNLVLRAMVFGLLKSCDLVCREMYRDYLYDGEDWNGEKSGVSLCEHVQTDRVLQLLDDALCWLGQTSKVSIIWREALKSRLLLRKTILLTLAHPTYPSQTLLSALQLLDTIRFHSPLGYTDRPTSSDVQNAFDPNISRRLISYAPTRTVELSSQEEVWEAMKAWIEQWIEVGCVRGSEKLWSVKVLGCVRAYEADKWKRIPFLRSSAITMFLDTKVLGTHEPSWLIDQFFAETGGVPASLLVDVAAEASSQFLSESDSILPLELPSQARKSDASFEQKPSASLSPSPPASMSMPSEQAELFEKGVAKLIVDYFTSFYHSRARQRRKLAASLLDWHLAFDQATNIVFPLLPLTEGWSALLRIPLCIRYARLSVISELLLSGFELELYSRQEWAMIYWYLGEILAKQVDIIDEIVKHWQADEKEKEDAEGGESKTDEREKAAKQFIFFQRKWAKSFGYFAEAMRDMLHYHSPTNVHIEPAREQANFEKRFKWTFISGYSEASTLDDDRPILGKWRLWKKAQNEDWIDETLDSLALAKDGLLHLISCSSSECCSEYCEEAYKELLRGHESACRTNFQFLLKRKQSRFQDHGNPITTNLLSWTWRSSKWFPEVGDIDSA